MQKEKIKESINSALAYLENSMQGLAKNNDEKAVVDSLWLASSEAEYALFLFSLMHPERLESSPSKHSSELKQVVEVDSALNSAQSLLKESKNNMVADATEKAYEKVWAAKKLLLKVQELFEKKRKSEAAQPATTR